MSGPKGGVIAARLRAARGYAGLKQPELAAQLGISKETLSRMENGRTKVESSTQERIARVTGVPLEFLLNGWAKPTSDRDDLKDQVDQLAQAVIELASGNAETALQAARAAVDQRRHETGRGAVARGHRQGRPGGDGR